MNYTFPRITDINEVRRACQNANKRVGTECFIERNTGHGYIVFDYIVSVRGLFPDLTGDEAVDRETKLVRECRGLIFDEKTGQVLARGYHKFFNANERPEVLEQNIDMTQEFVILEKLDGSMLRPVRPFDQRGPNDPIRFGTMMGWTEIAKPVDDFVAKSPYGYAHLVLDMEAANKTPIFEWCSRKQPIVIDYPQDMLVMTAVRDNITGEYFEYEQLEALAIQYDVPVVKTFRKQTSDLASLIQYVRGIKGMEGYIVRFKTGHMFKMKGDEYCFIHNTKEIMAKEKDVIQLIVEGKVDDVLPTLDEADRKSLSEFEELFHRNIKDGATRVQNQVEAWRVEFPTKKDFFLKCIKNPANNIAKDEEGFYTRAYDKQDVVQSMMAHIKLHMHSGPRVEAVRKLWGDVNWIEFRKPTFENKSLKSRAKRLWAKAVDAYRLFVLVK